MRRLWDADVEAGGAAVIRKATLAELGDAEQIVATHIDAALDRLSRDEQELAATMLRLLVTPSGATRCLTAHDLAVDIGRPQAEPEVEALAEKLSRPPARVLRGVAADGRSRSGGYELPQVLAEPASEWATRWRTRALETRARRLLLDLVTMTAIAIALAIAGYTFDSGPLRRLELASVDARFDLRGARADDRIVLVTRDRSPRNPRARMARALQAIATADPRAVALNISYIGPASAERHDDPAAADKELLAAIQGPLAKRLVLSTDQASVKSDDEAVAEAQLFGRLALRDRGTTPVVGWDGLPLDRGGVVPAGSRRTSTSSRAPGWRG